MPSRHSLRLTDESDGIVIVKSGAPEPSQELQDWLARACRGTWEWKADHVFNVDFHFEDAADAECFKARWHGVEL